jgi:hypothetical protein
MTHLIIFLLSIVVAVSAIDIRFCTRTETVGAECQITALQLAPTQLAYGRLASNCKTEKFESYTKVTKYEKYIIEHPVPVVKGPDNYYIVDHHHLIHALTDAKLQIDAPKNVIIKVIGDMSRYTDRKTFWSNMVNKNWAYPYDEYGNRVDISQKIPQNVTQLKNDPFRSLSYVTAGYGAFDKNASIPFVDFIWSNYYRNSSKMVELKNNGYSTDAKVELKALEKVFKDSLTISHDPAAKNLPGYLKKAGPQDPPTCDLFKKLTKKKVLADIVAQFLMD